MKSQYKIILVLLTVALSLPAIAEPFKPYRKQETPPFSINLGLGVSHGGEDVGGIIIVPLSGGNYYKEDLVNLGGEQSYFLGGIIALTENSEIWLSYAQMYDEAKYGKTTVILGDPNFSRKLSHDRYEAMYFWKTNRVRIGAGMIFDRNIKLHETFTGINETYKFDNTKGFGLGAGLDMPIDNNGNVVHFDLRYIKMKYYFETQEFNANSIGYFLSFSF